MIPWLDASYPQFPPPDSALDEPNGLLAAGGNLHASTLLNAYQMGIFPWFNAPDPILWWCPNPRMVLTPNNIHISRSMKKVLQQNPYHITCDTVFRKVMQACAGARNYTNETWISHDIIEGYCELHHLGFAHSIEVWDKESLVGGLYGVAIGCVFYGESMFSHANNASKIGFIHLCQILHECGFELIDCQVYSSHLASLGAYEMPRHNFLQHVSTLTKKSPNASPWAMINT
jgi:leucyl/phenylalanyl-tRNA--protein transferase